MMNKKILIGMVAGAALLGTGAGLMQAQASADEQEPSYSTPDHQGRPPRPVMNTDEMAKRIHETFGVDEAEVKAAIEANRDFRDIGQAAMLSKISGKSFKDVLGMKTEKNTWEDVGKSLGVTRDQVHEQMDDMMASRIEQKGNVDKDTALKLLRNGYWAQDIECAGLLAKKSGEDIQSVLDKKKINNRWSDVAEQLGVDWKSLRPQAGGPDKMGHGPQGGPPDGMMMVGPQNPDEG